MKNRRPPEEAPVGYEAAVDAIAGFPAIVDPDSHDGESEEFGRAFEVACETMISHGADEIEAGSWTDSAIGDAQADAAMK